MSFLNDTATTNIYTLSLHDALPIFRNGQEGVLLNPYDAAGFAEEALKLLGDQARARALGRAAQDRRSEEHTSELQSLRHLVCRLLLEKKKKMIEAGISIGESQVRAV